jgi:hypothetical protein
VTQNDFQSEIIKDLPINVLLSFYGPGRCKEVSIPVPIEGAGLFLIRVDKILCVEMESERSRIKSGSHYWSYGGDQTIGAVES